jgi:hypothetical protein
MASSQIERSSLYELERQPTMLFSPAFWNAPNNDPLPVQNAGVNSPKELTRRETTDVELALSFGTYDLMGRSTCACSLPLLPGTEEETAQLSNNGYIKGIKPYGLL